MKFRIFCRRLLQSYDKMKTDRWSHTAPILSSVSNPRFAPSISSQSRNLCQFGNPATYRPAARFGHLDDAMDSDNVVSKLSLSDHIFHLRNYYGSKSRINPNELCIMVDRICAEAGGFKATTAAPGLTPRDFQFLLQCCTTSRTPALRPATLTDLAERIWYDMPKYGLRYNHRLYDTLIDVYYANFDQRRQALQLLEDAKKLRCVNPRIRERLLCLACRQGDMDTAWSLFCDEWKDASTGITVYNHLIYGFLKAGIQEKYDDVVNIMKTKGMEWTSSTYSAMMAAFAETEKIQELFETLGEADRNNVIFDDDQMLDCVFALANNMGSCEPHLDKILDRLRQWELPKLTSLVQRLLAVDRPRVALHIFVASMKQSMEIDSSVGVGNFLVEQMFLIKSPIQSILDVCEILLTSKLNRRSYLTALRGAYVAGMEDAAVNIFARLRDLKSEIRPQYLFPLLALRARRGAPTQEFIDAIWTWYRSLQDEDKSDRLLDDAFFGIWYWPCVENSRQVRAAKHQSPDNAESLFVDLQDTLDSLVIGQRVRLSSAQPVTSGNVLTGFVHRCLSRGYADLIKKSLITFSDIHISGYKLRMALAKYYHRTGDTSVVIQVLKAAGRKKGEPMDSVGFRDANREVLNNLLNVISLQEFVDLLERMAEAELKLDTAAATKIEQHWTKACQKNRSGSNQQLQQRLTKGLSRMSKTIRPSDL